MRFGTWVAPLLLLMLNVGCGSNDTPGTIGAPESLVGTWKLSGPGVKENESLVLRHGELTIRGPCGEKSGGWRAGTGGLFIGEITSGDGSCREADEGEADEDFTPRWLAAATGFRVDGAGRLLVANSGEVTARLKPASKRPPDRAEQRRVAYFSRPGPPLPPGVQEVTNHSVRGRWVAVGPRANPAGFVDFGDEGQRSGSDGCNAVGGRYAVGTGGQLLALTGPQTAIGCQNSPAPGLVAFAARAGLQAGRMVLYDRTGVELGRLRRAP